MLSTASRASFLVAALTALLIVGCQNPAASPSPATPTPAATPAPSSTASPTASPSPTPRASATASRTPTASPTPTGPPSAVVPPVGYAQSCAKDVPWGRQVTRLFVCLDAPTAGAHVARGGRIEVRGYAGGSFESNVVIEVRALAAGQPAASTLAMTPLPYSAPDVGMPGGWQVSLPIPANAPAGAARVTAYFTSPRDGAIVARA